MSKKLSVILLSFNSEYKLEKAVAEIHQKLELEKIEHEIIIVDDGSADHSLKVANELQKKFTVVSVIALAKNYSSPIAQFAGLSVCTGGCAAPMPDDFQRPISHLVELYRLWEKGYKIIIGYRMKRKDGMLNDLFSTLYYKIMNTVTEINFPSGGTDGYLIDREIIDILNESKSKRNTTPVLELIQMGYNPLWLPYERPSTEHKSRWTLKKKIKLASDTFFGSTNWPLRMITYLGFATFLFSLILAIMIIIAKLFSDNTLFGLPIQGWATSVVLITIFNGLIMLCIGILAQYLWRIFEEVKGRPSFIIKKKIDNEPK
jgi:polyisoprenyl-phosphate glycosyltransferase